MQQHSVYPFSLLPPNVVDKIFSYYLDLQHLYQCSIVCQAWRRLPHSFLDVMTVTIPTRGPQVPPKQLQYCR